MGRGRKKENEEGRLMGDQWRAREGKEARDGKVGGAIFSPLKCDISLQRPNF